MSGYKVHVALTAIRDGIAKLLEEDGVIVMDLATELPEETASLEEALRSVVRGIQGADAMADAIKAQKDALGARETRVKARKEALRDVLFNALQMMPNSKITLPEATLSIRAGQPSVIITDETLLHPDYFRVVRTPDKTLIGKALKDGFTVAGAEMSNSRPSLTIRST